MTQTMNKIDISTVSDENLSAEIGRILKANDKTVSSAESCTGGEIAHLITLVSGASEYYYGSVVSYAIAVKENVLNVSPEVINQYGVVSSQVASAMAEGVRKLIGTDFAVATTGLAGTEGDGVNPGGTVWIGVASKNRKKTFKFQYKNDREHTIKKFAYTALRFLFEFINEELNSRLP